jgi:hypothetical protein
MTQVARLDLARSRTAPDREGAGGGAASSIAGLPRVAQVHLGANSATSSVHVSRSVPGWAVVTAALTPVVLVGGWLAAGALQPSYYSPAQQTMSALAGQTGTDPWVMTSALFLVGASQIATAGGLTGVRLPARILLLVTGLCTIGVASSPDPAAGPTPLHLAFAVSCVFTTAIWPALVAQRPPAPTWIVSIYGCTVVTAVFAVLSGWVLFATFGAGELGLAERVTSAALGLFPLVVALSLRQGAAQDARSPSS